MQMAKVGRRTKFGMAGRSVGRSGCGASSDRAGNDDRSISLARWMDWGSEAAVIFSALSRGGFGRAMLVVRRRLQPYFRHASALRPFCLAEEGKGREEGREGTFKIE